VETSKKDWSWWQKLVAAAIVLAAARYGGDLLERWQNGSRPKIQEEITNAPSVEQVFDEHLSLKMPVKFTPVTDFPIQQMAKEARERIQSATQRTAFFNGVSVGVIHMVPLPGVIDSGKQYYNLQSALNGGFWNYYPDKQPPKIDWGSQNEVYQSGAMTFTINVGGTPSQMTTVAVALKSGEGFWMIMADGSGEAAKLADETARDFVFK
jgi:hypothetical protein